MPQVSDGDLQGRRTLPRCRDLEGADTGHTRLVVASLGPVVGAAFERQFWKVSNLASLREDDNAQRTASGRVALAGIGGILRFTAIF